MICEKLFLWESFLYFLANSLSRFKITNSLTNLTN